MKFLLKMKNKIITILRQLVKIPSYTFSCILPYKLKTKVKDKNWKENYTILLGKYFIVKKKKSPLVYNLNFCNPKNIGWKKKKN